MTRLNRLIDFQITGSVSLREDESRVNRQLFAVYEPLRLWLREHDIRAPFRKLVITMGDPHTFAQWNAAVTNVLGICEVTRAVGLDAQRERSVDHRWVLDVIREAMQDVVRETGWKCVEFDSFVDALKERETPLEHVFSALVVEDPSSGIRCEPWLSAEPGTTRIGVRFLRAGEAIRSVVLLSKAGPIWIEDDFPLAKAKIRAGSFYLTDKAGRELAAVKLVS